MIVHLYDEMQQEKLNFSFKSLQIMKLFQQKNLSEVTVRPCRYHHPSLEPQMTSYRIF